jgi:hypothetical protein
MSERLRYNVLGVLTVVALLAACSSPRPKTGAPAAAPMTGRIEEIHLLAIPMALNLDQKPGLDGFGIKVYAINRALPKPLPIRDGTLEILMYDGFVDDTNARPRCTWKYQPEELAKYERTATVGPAYEFAPRWTTNNPSQNRITVIARYTSPEGAPLDSAASIIAVPGP